jgi:aryl-alcohol dehydrogenase-like predicted oxidoreductase
MISRRELLAAGAALALLRRGHAAPAKATKMLTRDIPKTREPLPVIGLGTWQTFDVDASEAEKQPRVELLRRFFAAGGRVIDSSPMYGASEERVGDFLAPLGGTVRPFLATKVWTQGKRAGIDQMTRSLRRMRTKTMDLMQVHNLLDADTHLATLREWKAAGRIRYLGVTHYLTSTFPEIERRLEQDALDFIQIPYSVVRREAEARLLPAAAAHGVAVLVMRPFEEGALFQRVRGKPVPAWAADIDCTSWAQIFLKWILAHPAVTCPIPATSKPDHLSDNVRAGMGRLPDANLRAKIQAAIA